MKKSFNIQELLHHKSKCHGMKAHAPLLVEIYPKTPRTGSEVSQFGGSHNHKTKQSKLPSFIDRWVTSFKNFLVLVSKPTWSPWMRNLFARDNEYMLKILLMVLNMAIGSLYRNTSISPWPYKHQCRLCGQHCFFIQNKVCFFKPKTWENFGFFGLNF